MFWDLSGFRILVFRCEVSGGMVGALNQLGRDERSCIPPVQSTVNETKKERQRERERDRERARARCFYHYVYTQF